MSNPLALLPLAIAAGGGRIAAVGEDEPYEAQQLVAAGITLLQRSAPLVRALQGRRSAILLPTSPHFVLALAASEGRGAVLINPLASPAEIAFQIADSNVGAVFTLAAFAPRLPAEVAVVLLDDMPRIARVSTPARTHDVDLGSHHGLSLEGERNVAGRDEEAVVVYTSAMQGVPCGAILTHRNLIANAMSTVDALGIDADSHALALLPYAHLFGLTVTCNAMLMAGGRVSTLDRFHPVKAVDGLLAGVTHFASVPSVYLAMLNAMERRDVKLRDGTLRLCIVGGAAVSIELQDRWYEATGVELRQGYGLTEAAPVCLFNRHDIPNVRGSLGVAMPGVEVSIFPPADYDDAGRQPAAAEPLADGIAGEICIRGENVSPGYVKDAPGLPIRANWLYTGDEGVRDETGHVRFLGLLKPMFTRNGFNIYPREIERVVGEMPGVVRVQVSPIPESAKENDISLRVVGDVTEDDVRRWCELRLSVYKQPSVVEIAID